VTALAACAVVGWWSGGRLGLAVLWTTLAGWVVWRESQVGTYSLLLAGWALVLGASFGALSLRRAAHAPPFFPRALSALGVTLLLAGAAVLAAPGGPTQTRTEATAEFSRRADAALRDWNTMTATPEWKQFVTANPTADSLAQQMTAQIQATPAASVTLFPAMLALESLAALALAWALYHRFGRARLGPPLARVRDFRFSDQLVWGLVAGLALVVVPGFAPLRAVGANLLMFFGAIYALRGMGVALYFLAPGRWLMVLLVGFSLLFYNVVGVLALGLGLGDTWLDWRRRARPKT
ncbi:MAG: DUF2232 domain-containing protein, partial [Gemmatimonadetes bacterium]|nr:DUF2232 domain-containing protein [Gemmatimonadota bacterium]